MKHCFFLFFALLTLNLFPQQSPAPFINYQGVARELSGAPITGTLGIKLELHQGGGGGTVVFSEVHNPVTNQFGVFNIRIGSVNTSDFAAIVWANGPYHLEVKMDPLGGTSYDPISNQELVSVPYALYAKEAKNVRNYVAGTNVTIDSPSSGNTYTINAAGGNSAGVSSLTVLPLNHTVTSIGNAHTVNIASPVISAPGTPISVGNIFPNYILGYTYPTLSLNGNILSIQQGTYNSPTVTFTTGASIPTWTINSGNIVQTNTNVLVGIGTNIPTAKLDVFTNPASTNNAIAANSIGGNGLFATTSSASNLNAGVVASNSGNGNGVYGTAVSTNSLMAGVQGQNTGAGPGVFGAHGSNSILGSANGVRGETNATNILASGVSGVNLSAGSGVYGENLTVNPSAGANGVYGKSANPSPIAYGVKGINTNIGAGVYGENTNSVSTSGNGHGVYGRSNGSDLTTYGVFGKHFGQGSGVFGNTSSSSSFAYGVYGLNSGAGSGVYGETSSNGAGFVAGVYGLSTGDMPAMLARNMSASASTAASGIRAMTNSSNTQAAGVYGENLGAGPAVKASLATTVSAGSNNVAVLMEHGHIKSIGSVPTISTVTSAGIAPGPTLSSFINAVSTDVKGNVAINFTTTANSVFNGGSIDLVINFNKPYSPVAVPVILLTPTTDLQGMDYRVVGVTNLGFTIRVYKPNNPVVSEPASLPANGTFNFNYFVIE